MKQTTITLLKDRGLIQDISDEENLNQVLQSSKISFYCGFDPTSESLHVGNLLPILVMRKLTSLGHNAYALIGTGTGMIGDPSGKSAERNLLEENTVLKNTEKLEIQLSSLFNNTKINVVKNGDWLSKYSYIEVLRDIGKNFSVNQMIARDSVKSRLTEREQGISYTEFSYMILQAIDFLHLYQHNNCCLQIGGSDQWGNIMSGVDLIRRKIPNSKSFGLTIPLLLNSNGKKFGKTEDGAVWLSEEKTSAYKFYQFWLNTSDEDVIRYSKLFTDAEMSYLIELENEHKAKPELRKAQTFLAQYVTALVHGEAKANQAKKASEILFGNKSLQLSSNDLLLLKNEIPTKIFKESEITSTPLVDILLSLEAADSKGSLRKLIQNGGVSINEQKVTEAAYLLSSKDFIDQKTMLLKTGKKNYYLVLLN